MKSQVRLALCAMLNVEKVPANIEKAHDELLAMCHRVNRGSLSTETLALLILLTNNAQDNGKAVTVSDVAAVVLDVAQFVPGVPVLVRWGRHSSPATFVRMADDGKMQVRYDKNDKEVIVSPGRVRLKDSNG